jgi:hypothetical protein
MNPTTELAVRPSAQLVTREEFGATNLQTHVETAAMAVAEREKAAVQARYIIAERRPRNIEQFRVRLEESCRRPSFAAKVEFAKPIGKEQDDNGTWVNKYAYGPTIRFVEVALQAYGNVFPEVTTVFDSETLRICRVSVTDLESNICYATEVAVTKQVERKGKKEGNGKNAKWQPPAGRIVLGERINSYGDPTYTVLATDDEVLVKQNALLSKALRTNAQRLLPWDIVERCMQLAKDTLANEHAQDPDAAKRRLVDAFTTIGVEPIDLEAWLGHSLNKPLVPAEREQLLKIHAAIKEGETTWQDVMSEKAETGSEQLQQEVLSRKLAELEAGRTQQQQNTTKVAEGSDNSAASSEPAVSGQGAAQDSEAPELIDEQQGMDLMSLAGEKGMPQPELQKILVKLGFKTPGAITKDRFKDVIAAVQAWTPEQAAETSRPKLQFGGKK